VRVSWQSLSIYSALVLVIGLIVLSFGTWRREALIQRPMLPVSFDHAIHTSVQCADCHHNFVDNSGGGMCYHCHKTTEEISGDIEQTFHNFCRDCHIELRQQGEASGPLRSCGQCHQGTTGTF